MLPMLLFMTMVKLFMNIKNKGVKMENVILSIIISLFLSLFVACVMFMIIMYAIDLIQNIKSKKTIKELKN